MMVKPQVSYKFISQTPLAHSNWEELPPMAELTYVCFHKTTPTDIWCVTEPSLAFLLGDAFFSAKLTYPKNGVTLSFPECVQDMILSETKWCIHATTGKRVT